MKRFFIAILVLFSASIALAQNTHTVQQGETFYALSKKYAVEISEIINQNPHAAYGLKTPDDSKRLYAAWAKTYDAGFAARMDYCLPERVVQAFVRRGPSGPILDIGAGTGLGLATVYGIIRQTGGYLDVVSKVKTESIESQGLPQSILITLPPLSTVFYRLK